MKSIYYYFLLQPIESEYVLSEKDIPSAKVTYKKTDGTEFKLEFFPKKDSPDQISNFRLIFPNFKKPELGEEEFKIIQDIKEYALAILRILYSPFVTLHPFAPSLAFEGHFETKLVLPATISQPSFSFKHLQGALINGIEFKEDLILLSDSYNKYLLSIYKYLSVFKLFEKHAVGIEKADLLKKYLSKYDEEYKKLNISKMAIQNFAIDLRTRCAHFVTNKKGQGLRAHINQEIRVVEQFLPIIQQAAIDLLNKESNTKFILKWQHEPRWEVLS